MRSFLAAPLVLLLACAGDGVHGGPRAAAASSAAATHADYDVIIRGGEVIDGTGTPRRRADVGIRGDVITTIGDLSKATAVTTIDATGKVVAPGFIDLLGHSEGPVLIDPHLEGKVRQGVTTEVTGEGHSPGPIDDAMAAEVNRTRLPGYPDATWRTLGDYMREIEKRGTAINFAFYIGAANPREIVLGKMNRKPTPEQLEKMRALVDAAMKDGAIGMSSALIYPPGSFADTDELIELAKVVSKYGGGYWTHMRSEADRIDSAIDEAIRISREAHVPLNIFHLKVGGRKNWGKMKEIVARIERERKAGVDVAANVYPYTATSTDLTSLLPDWSLEGGYSALVNRLHDPATRQKIGEEIRAGGFYDRLGGASGVLIRRIPAPALAPYERKKLDVIAKEMNVDPIEALLRMFEQSSFSPTAIFFSLSEEDVMTALKQPWVAVGSDSGAVVGAMKQMGAHPRAYGTFPRILGHYVRDEKLFTLEEAVRKMTSLAASRAGFADRGVLKSGMKADVVVFDPGTIRDLSTYEDPHHYSEGVLDVIVNGKTVLLNGTMTDALPGKVLRRASR